MLCYTINKYGLTPYIWLTHNKKRGSYCLSLGTPEGVVTRLFLFKKNPPSIKNGKISEAHPVRIRVRDKEYWTLAKPRNPADQRILVRITTRNPLALNKKSTGRIKILKGHPRVVAEGGVPGRYKDYLLILHKNDVVHVYFEGSQEPRYVVRVTTRNGSETYLECIDVSKEPGL